MAGFHFHVIQVGFFVNWIQRTANPYIPENISKKGLLMYEVQEEMILVVILP